ncbi:MAG TPA: ATP-binding protein [Candidatus Nanoarchaeia archaeon]|nr:ATP-binding protein [Candidatus Nanoarchaeia archaeon]
MSYYIIIRGPLGCGKSTLAERVAKMLKAEYIAIDRVLDEHDLTKDKEAGYISQKSFKKANEIVALKAKKLLVKGTPIIFDGNFYWKSQVDDLIKRLNFPHYVFTLKAPLEVCIERDSKRKKTHGKDAARVVYAKATEFDYGEIIDVTKPLEESVRKILSHLPR